MRRNGLAEEARLEPARVTRWLGVMLLPVLAVSLAACGDSEQAGGSYDGAPDDGGANAPGRARTDGGATVYEDALADSPLAPSQRLDASAVTGLDSATRDALVRPLDVAPGPATSDALLALDTSAIDAGIPDAGREVAPADGPGLPTATLTSTLTRTLTTLPTGTATATLTLTVTPTSTSTATSTSTGTVTLVPTATATATSTLTRTLTSLPTGTIIGTLTRTLTEIPTVTTTVVPTGTIIGTLTRTVTDIPTATLTLLPTLTYTSTLTRTLIDSPTFTLTSGLAKTALP